jgi:O-antigen/teichoic acid export membrane protein
MLLFALGVGLTGSLMVLDSAMVGLLRGELQLWRNSVFAVSKLLLLLGVSFWLGRQAGMTIVATWVLGLAVSLVAFLRPSALRSIAGGDIRPRIATMTRLSGLAVRHHLLNMAIAAPHLALPLLVTVLLSASANAYFYSAWMMASVMFIGLFSLTSTLYASGRGTPTALWRKVRLTLALALGAGLAGNLLFLLAGQQLLGFFGASYAEQATPVLRVVALGVFTLGIREHYITIRRIEDDLGSTAVVTAVGGLLELALAALGASLGGLLGLGIGWVAATCLEALYMAPTVIRAALPRAPLEARTAVV